jgi:CxxC motif-containing protein
MSADTSKNVELTGAFTAVTTTKTTDLVCIACPIACRLTVTQAGAEVTVTGNRCPKGEAYGREEILAPKRMVTAVVPTDSQDFPCAPVRTTTAIHREKVKELLGRLYSSTVRLPVARGQVLIEDFDGAQVLFTRTLPPDDVPPVGEPRAESKG